LKNKLVQEAQRLEKIERDKKEADAKKKAELDEKLRKTKEIGCRCLLLGLVQFLVFIKYGNNDLR
jgi:hypothetical protein